MGHVVADDIDLVDRGDLAFLEVPGEVHHPGAVRQGAPRLLRHHLRVDVARVRVEVAQPAGGRFPGRPVEVHRAFGGAGEGVVSLQLLGRVAAVSLDLELADLVDRPFVDREPQDRLPRGAVRDQGVAGDLEVDVAAAPVPTRQALAGILVHLPLVVLAVAEPPEGLGPARHLPHHLPIGEARVPLDVHLADGDAAAFLHGEHDAQAAAGIRRELHGRHLGGVVAAVAVHRIDRRLGAGHGSAVDGPAFDELDPVPDVRRRELARSRHRPAREQRALAHAEDDDAPARGEALGDGHVVELAGPVERGDRALDVPVVDRRADGEAGGRHDLRRSDPGIALDGDAVHTGLDRDRVLGAKRRRPGKRQQEGGHRGKAHAHGWRNERRRSGDRRHSS